jgi:hypothetical protein
VANQSVSANNYLGEVGVLLGNGDGTFQATQSYTSGGYFASAIAVADVNMDGKPDLLVSNTYFSEGIAGGGVGVLLGNGDGTFQAAQSYTSGGVYAVSIAVADVNDDGKPDILVANTGFNNSESEGGVGVLLGNGDGTFQAAKSYVSGGGSAASIAVADVNGDGEPDIVVANPCSVQDYCPTGGVVGVLLGNGDGSFQPVQTYSSGGVLAYSIAIADVNGDGKPDLLVANECATYGCPGGTGALGVLLGNGDGTFQPAQITSTPWTLGEGQIALADFNGDGKLDVAIGSGSILLFGNGDGTFTMPLYFGVTGPGIAVGNFNGDGSPDLAVGGTILLNRALKILPTTTALSSSTDPSAFEQSVTFTATVTSQGPGMPTGTVIFSDDSTTLGISSLNGRMATFATTGLTVGLHSINTVYSGDFKFKSSSASLNQTVSKASTRLKLISSFNPSGLDSPVTFTATVTPQYGGQATGTVTFKDGGTVLGSVTVSGNAASLTTSGLAMGTHSITSVYSGDSNFLGSTSNALSQGVTKATTATSLVSSINPSVSGKPVTFTAVVSSLAGTPTGKIEYLKGETVLATIKLTSGSAKYTTTKLPPGANSVMVVYEGDSNNNGSTSAPVNQIVLATTTTTLSSSPNPSIYGNAVTFTAVVNSGIGSPADGEAVTFDSGTQLMGTGRLSGGTATFTTSALTVGTKSVKAVYGGDSKLAGSTSNLVKQVVQK